MGFLARKIVRGTNDQFFYRALAQAAACLLSPSLRVSILYAIITNVAVLRAIGDFAERSVLVSLILLQRALGTVEQREVKHLYT